MGAATGSHSVRVDRYLFQTPSVSHPDEIRLWTILMWAG
jgi:hypothetical protein